MTDGYSGSFSNISLSPYTYTSLSLTQKSKLPKLTRLLRRRSSDMSSSCFRLSTTVGSSSMSLRKTLNLSPPNHFRSTFPSSSSPLHHHLCLKFSGLHRTLRQKFHRYNLRPILIQINSVGEDTDTGFTAFDEWGGGGDYDGMTYDDDETSYSSGDESDTELVINPIGDVDLPSVSERFDSTDGAITVTAHRLGILQRRSNRRGRSQAGCFNNIGLIAFSLTLLLFVDWCSWRIIRLPLDPGYLTRPFLVSAALTSTAGFLCIPILDKLRIHQAIRREGPLAHSSKKGTPTMGGLFFIPIGIAVARFTIGVSSAEAFGAAAATLAFAMIGLLDDLCGSFMKNHNDGLPPWMKFLLQVAVGTSFSFWLDSTSISSPYSMKKLVALPAPLGLLYVGKFYAYLTTSCFVSMGNGVNLTDGLDGLAGGTAALSFIGMSISVLPISCDLSIFGVSMAGACIGFLLHNRYKASIFMGDTGSLALGGGLAAMAACTGMFFPLFIASGIFVLEALSVLMQVSYFKATKYLYGRGRRLLRMAPLHHHLKLCGMKEPLIVASTYVVSCVLTLFCGYVGLISA